MDKRVPEFVVQEHQTPDGIHWDVMLQTGQSLRTWRMHRPPADIGNEPLELEQIADHPLRFLTYEGPVQNQTGRVIIADHGVYQLISHTPDALAVEFKGRILRGRFTIKKTSAQGLWTLAVCPS